MIPGLLAARPHDALRLVLAGVVQSRCMEEQKVGEAGGGLVDRAATGWAEGALDGVATVGLDGEESRRSLHRNGGLGHGKLWCVSRPRYLLTLGTTADDRERRRRRARVPHATTMAATRD